MINKNGVEISVGKQRRFFQKRYFIKIDNVVKYYYNEFLFWKVFFRICDEYELDRVERFELGSPLK